MCNQKFSLLFEVSLYFLITIKGKHNFPLQYTLHFYISVIDSMMSRHVWNLQEDIWQIIYKSTILYDSGLIFKENSAHKCMKSLNFSLTHTGCVVYSEEGKSIYLSLLSGPSRRTAGGEQGSGRSGRTTFRTAPSGMSGCCSFSASLRGGKEKEPEKDETHPLCLCRPPWHLSECVCVIFFEERV